MKGARHILAIDPGTSMGVARWEAPAAIWSDTERLEGATVGQRLHHARAYLGRKFAAFEARSRPIDLVVIEDFHATGFARGEGNAKSNEFLTMLRGVLIEVSEAYRVPYAMVPAATWRKTFLGYGRAPKGSKGFPWKAKAVARCAALGWAPNRHDEAEALGILFHARTRAQPSFGVEATPLFSGAA